MQKELGISPRNMDYIFSLPGKKVFEVIFATNSVFEICLQTFAKLKQTRTHLSDIEMIPLSEVKPKAITMLMYSKHVKNEDIKSWLSFQCVVIKGHELKDEDGIKTGARHFFVHL